VLHKEANNVDYSAFIYKVVEIGGFLEGKRNVRNVKVMLSGLGPFWRNSSAQYAVRSASSEHCECVYNVRVFSCRPKTSNPALMHTVYWVLVK
jgi:hypothetical protein